MKNCAILLFFFLFNPQQRFKTLTGKIEFAETETILRWLILHIFHYTVMFARCNTYSSAFVYRRLCRRKISMHIECVIAKLFILSSSIQPDVCIILFLQESDAEAGPSGVQLPLCPGGRRNSLPKADPGEPFASWNSV